MKKFAQFISDISIFGKFGARSLRAFGRAFITKKKVHDPFPQFTIV